jgi:hypothetical protein
MSKVYMVLMLYLYVVRGGFVEYVQSGEESYCFFFYFFFTALTAVSCSLWHTYAM